MSRDLSGTYHELSLSYQSPFAQDSSISTMSHPTNRYINYSRPFDLSRSTINSGDAPSSHHHNMSVSGNKQTNQPSPLSHHTTHQNNPTASSSDQNGQIKNISNPSVNQNNPIAPYPPLRERNNFHATSILRQRHESITPTPLRQSTTAASLGQLDGGMRSNTVSPSKPSVQYKNIASSSAQTNHNASSSSFSQIGDGIVSGGNGAGVLSSSSPRFQSFPPAAYPSATNSHRNQSTNTGSHDPRSHSSPQPTQHSKSNSSAQIATGSANHTPTSTRTRNRLPTSSASPAPSSHRPEKTKRPDIEPRYDPSLTLAERLEASTDLPLAPFSEYEWKKENEYEYLTSWQPPERHSEEWRQRDLEGWR